MIHDLFSNLHRHAGVPHLEAIRQFVSGRDCLTVPNGEHEILGRDLFVRVAEYETRSAADAAKQFEAHRGHLDLQYVVMGQEIMTCSAGSVFVSGAPDPTTVYDPKADIQFFKDPAAASSLLVRAGEFAVFFPGEMHKPGCQAGPSPSKVKKLVFKVRMA